MTPVDFLHPVSRPHTNRQKSHRGRLCQPDEWGPNRTGGLSRRTNRIGKQYRDLYPSWAKVIPNEDFTHAIAFDNGEEGILDIKPHLDVGVFQKLRDYEHFQRVRFSFDTIEWDRCVDLDPEFVYAKCEMTTKA